MIDYLGLENVIYGVLIFLFYTAYKLDSSSKYALNHIGMLQARVDELEERLGIKEPFDMDPLGFTRKNDAD